MSAATDLDISLRQCPSTSVEKEGRNRESHEKFKHWERYFYCLCLQTVDSDVQCTPLSCVALLMLVTHQRNAIFSWVLTLEVHFDAFWQHWGELF